ncbi:sensor histidine kinase [Salinimicrobium sp. HB62]|uniref:sensor histidine kinase n=1 Tax=Salinimicrobium sp. HB62 TaxID=3077781 RepID=UPI002D79248E|nr:histidine kinase [Salinimicrobium sp. HB62]
MKKNRENVLIFYFYAKVDRIKKSKATKRSRSQVQVILEKLGIAAITTIILYTLVVYLNFGTIKLPQGEMLIEIPLVFFFLFFLFISHEKISRLFASPKFERTGAPKKAILEVFIVIVVTIFLTFLLNFLPLLFVLGEEIFVPVRVRTAVMVSVVVSLFFYYFVERERTKKELQQEMLNSARLQKENFEAQLEGLKSQINPHFLFNSLNVLGSLIQQDKKKALTFKNKLADLYRSLLKHGEQQLIPLDQELETARSYIYLLKTRFGNSIVFEEEISPQPPGLLVPPGALQMLLENAIKHNGSTKKKPLFVKIFTEENYLVVQNNLQPRKEHIYSTKTGLKNISSRYRYLSSEEVKIDKTKEKFIVKLPLLKTHESSNH